MRVYVALAGFVAVLPLTSLHAQNRQPVSLGSVPNGATSSATVASAARATSAPTIDGVPGDPVWETAPLIDQFLEYEPNEGAETRFRTEARLLYDDRNLYVLVRMFDPAPDSIVSQLAWGNGRSPGTRGATDIDNAVDDHLAARRKLREQPLPVFVLGHSVGGLVTATSILRDQSGVRGMILIAPALKWEVSGALRVVARVGGFLVPTFPMPVPPGDPTHQSRDMQLNERLAKDPLYHMGKISWVTAGSGATTSHVNWKRYEHITVPVLVVNGTGDKVAVPSASREFIEAVRSEDKTLSLVDGGRHSLLDDPPSNAEALQVILGWLDRRVPKNDAVKP